MKTLLYVLAFSCMSALSLGERTLEKSEVNGLLQMLTQSPQRTWLPAGTIQIGRASCWGRV